MGWGLGGSNPYSTHRPGGGISDYQRRYSPQQNATMNAWFRSAGLANNPHQNWTSEGFHSFANDYSTMGENIFSPQTPSYSGGGGGGYGGGGGGGGGGGMTQAMLNSMLQALGVGGAQLSYTPVDLPDFQGQPLAAFNAQPYTQALGNINTAVTRDQAASQAAGRQASKALQSNYTNAYANAPMTMAQPAQQVGAGLQETTGGGGNQAQIAQASDAAAGSDQASFANLLNVLAAADQTAQSSRMNQVALDQATAGRSINAQALGLRGGVNMAQSQARNQWQQAAAERAYQNSLMQQQWQREEMMRNQDLTNQTTQANWTQRNEMINNRLTPLLQLLGQGGQGLDMSGLQKLLQQWAA